MNIVEQARKDGTGIWSYRIQEIDGKFTIVRVEYSVTGLPLKTEAVNLEDGNAENLVNTLEMMLVDAKYLPMFEGVGVPEIVQQAISGPVEEDHSHDDHQI